MEGDGQTSPHGAGGLRNRTGIDGTFHKVQLYKDQWLTTSASILQGCQERSMAGPALLTQLYLVSSVIGAHVPPAM